MCAISRSPPSGIPGHAVTEVLLTVVEWSNKDEKGEEDSFCPIVPCRSLWLWQCGTCYTGALRTAGALSGTQCLAGRAWSPDSRNIRAVTVCAWTWKGVYVLQVNKTLRPSEQIMALPNLDKVPTAVVLVASQVLRQWT